MHAEFLVSAFSESDFPPEGVPEIVLAGRSNVGKSSLINRLAGQKNLARTSATPGKTRSINFYRLDRSFCLVDLPGYGYSTAGKAASRQWKHLVDKYFRSRERVALVIQLVDSRIPPTPLDFQLAAWIDGLELRRLLVATKADKLSGNQQAVQRRRISEAFGDMPVTLASAMTGEGCREIWKRILEALPGERVKETSREN
jgi:GTP-binding protein